MEIRDAADLCFPHLLNSSCRKPTPPWTEAVLLNIVLSFISLITVVLNLLVIISVSHFRQLHTPTNILLLSLAVSDLFVGLLLMPAEIYRKISCWFFGDIVCVINYYLMANILTASVAHIVLISADRYMAICLPLHYPTRITLAGVKCCVCLCWGWSAFYMTFFLTDELVQPGRSNSCIGECTVFINYVAGTVDLFLNFIIPVTTIIFLYMRVFMVAVSQARTMRSHITAVSLHLSVNLKTKKSELKAARTLGVLVTVFLMCYCPYYCCFYVVDDIMNTSYAAVLFLLCYFNSCLNPLIYALFYPWFRKSIKLIVTLQILQPGSCQTKILERGCRVTINTPLLHEK